MMAKERDADLPSFCVLTKGAQGRLHSCAPHTHTLCMSNPPAHCTTVTPHCCTQWQVWPQEGGGWETLSASSAPSGKDKC